MELGRLTAIFDADTRKFDAGMLGVQSKIGGVTTGLTGITSSTNQLTASLNPAGTGLTGLSTKIGAVAGVSVIAATAIGGVVGGLLELAKSTAAYGGHLQDLNDRTGIGVENLSALKLAFDESGGSIDSGSAALSRYLRSVSDASTGNDKLKQKFLDVGFTLDDLNASYGDSDRAVELLVKRVGEMGNSQDRLNALQKLGVRNGQELNGAIVAMKGNLEQFRKEAERLGLVITPEQARAADDFDDSLALLEKQVKGMGFTIAHQYLPEISGAIHDVSGALSDNRGAWSDWGSFVQTEIRGIRVAAAGLSGFMAGMKFGMPPGAAALWGITDAILKSRELHAQDSVGVGASVGSGITRGRSLGLNDDGGGGGGRGGGGGADPAQAAKRIAELQLQAVIDGLKAESEANRRSLELRRRDFNSYATQYMVIEERRHEAVINGLNAEEQAAKKLRKGQDVALLEIANKRTQENTTYEQNRNKVLDERGKILDEINGFIRDQEREINEVTAQTSQWDQAYSQLVETLKEEGVTLEANTRKRIESNIAYAKELELVLSVTRARIVGESVRDRITTKGMLNRPPWIDLGGGSTVGGEPGTTTRPRIATVEQQVMRERMQMIREQMMELGQDLTGIFARSIGDGFDQGAKHGLATLAQGLLDIVENIFLKRLAEGLGNILTNAASGGGWLGKLLNIGGAAVLGGIGGGLAPGVAGKAFNNVIPGLHFSRGGMVPGTDYGYDSVPAMLRPGERVLPVGASGETVVNNYTIQMPPIPRGGGYSSPKSQRQMAEHLLAALQGAQS